MDPLSALGVAGNVIAFVDFAAKLFKSTHELYHSASGSSSTVTSLAMLSDELSALSNSFAPEDLKSLDLSNVASRCDSIAKEIQALVNKLTLKEPNKAGRWSSFAVALRTVMSDGQVRSLEKRVDQVQLQLGLQIQKLAITQQSKLLQAFQRLEEDNQRIDLDRNEESFMFKQLLFDTLAGLRVDKDPLKNTPQGVWADQLRLLPSAMTKTSVTMNQIAEEQRFLQSLHFEEMRRRLDHVVLAHHQTFAWIFEDNTSEEHGSISIGFKDWAVNRSGHFWLEGKAGSGKSTLMKFICAHPQTEKLLASWANSVKKRLVTSQYFFWHSGTQLEKSQEGLLRSLLFGILSKCPELIPKVRPDDAATLDAAFDWTKEQLFNVFQKLTTQRLPLRFCFFIDGLDEYAGHHAELIETLTYLMALPDVKICLSSRPWPPFRDAFGDVKERTIKLQDLTRNDIRSYATDRLLTNKVFRSMVANDQQYETLVEDVVNRAEGVFLWVVLVVRSLLDGIHDRDLISGLRDRLDQLPQSLEELFRHMISQIDDVYMRSRTVRAFQYALASPEPPLLALYFMIDAQEKQGTDTQERSEPLTLETYEIMRKTMEMRLEARCKGLLEVSSNFSSKALARGSSAPFFLFRHTVVFYHRTVFDFLKANFEEIFREQAGQSFSIHLTLCGALVSALQITCTARKYAIVGEAKLCHDLLDQLCYHARAVEIHQQTGDEVRRCSQLLSEIEASLHEAEWWKWRRKKAAFVGMAVEWGLHHFVEQEITAHPDLVRAREKPLLDYALLPEENQYANERLRSGRMVSMLLDAGANPNAKFQDATVWTRFLVHLLDKPGMATETVIVDITRELVRAGADPRSPVRRKEEYMIPAVKPKSTGRGSDLFKSSTPARKGTRIVEEFMAEEVIKGIFGKGRFDFIMSAQPRETSVRQMFRNLWHNQIAH